MAKLIFSMRWQVRHSNVRCSNPRSPGEIRANPILCLQVGHIGRSPLELRITYTQDTMIRLGQRPACPFTTPTEQARPPPWESSGSARHGPTELLVLQEVQLSKVRKSFDGEILHIGLTRF
jgi:hypothetical protein